MIKYVILYSFFLTWISLMVRGSLENVHHSFILIFHTLLYMYVLLCLRPVIFIIFRLVIIPQEIRPKRLFYTKKKHHIFSRLLVKILNHRHVLYVDSIYLFFSHLKKNVAFKAINSINVFPSKWENVHALWFFDRLNRIWKMDRTLIIVFISILFRIYYLIQSFS